MPAVKSDKNAAGFRDMKEIFIGEMPRPLPLVNINDKIVSKVGGMMGLGAKESKLEIHLDQNQYYNGDLCTVKLVCDNKESSVPVKNFKLKLKRKVFAEALDRNTNKEVKIKDSRYIYQHKDSEFKVKAGKKEEGQIQFQIPKDDPDLPPDGKSQRCLKNEFLVSCNLTQSCAYKLFQVQYTLKVFIKYDRITERGEGDCVTIPLRILEKPVDFRPEKSKYTKTGKDLVELERRPGIALEVSEASLKYKEEFIDKYQEKWLSNTTGEFTKVTSVGGGPIAPSRPAPVPVPQASAGAASAGDVVVQPQLVQEESKECADVEGIPALWSKFVTAGTVMTED